MNIWTKEKINMINVRVVNIKSWVKHLILIILFSTLIYIIFFIFNKTKDDNNLSFMHTISSTDKNESSQSADEEVQKSNNIKLQDDTQSYNISSINGSLLLSILDQSIPGIKDINQHDFPISETSYIESTNPLHFLLSSELPVMTAMVSKFEDDEVSVSENNDLPLEHADTNVATQVIENNVPNNYTDNYNGVEIKNGTNYSLTEDILNCDNLDINKNDVIIFHTHTCESYTPTENYSYEESGTFRTIDLNYSVSRVGDSLTDQLLSYGFNVIHDKTYHDYPAYSGSYGRSMATVENLLISHPNTDIIIDLHRDAIADTTYAPSVKIGDEVVSQLMFVIGTDGGGLEHPNWQQNLKFAIAFQRKANELYPGLFRPILLRNSRYNQQLGKAACIIEVGATGNTLEQSMASMKYLSKVLDEVLKN